LKKEWDDAKLKAGLTDVSGPGIVINLVDAKVVNFSLEASIIHDKDLLSILNELKKAGAQAISINDERVISSTEQICAGSTILINKRRFAMPFEIKAIGNSTYLYDTMIGSEIVHLLKEANIKVTISKSNKVYIRKYDGVIAS